MVNQVDNNRWENPFTSLESFTLSSAHQSLTHALFTRQTNMAGSMEHAARNGNCKVLISGNVMAWKDTLSPEGSRFQILRTMSVSGNLCCRLRVAEHSSVSDIS